MRLVSYRLKGEAGVGVIVDDKNFVALPKAAPELPRSLKGLIEMEGGFAKAAAAAKGRKPDLAFSDVVLDPLITEPNAIWCLALNYKLHINETGLTTSAKYPQIFLRMPCSQVGHLQPILCPDPKISTKYEYEGELAVIIGKPGRHIPVGAALSHVAGYACYNEGSVREFQGHNRQFGLGKNFERSGSFGPWMLTADEFGDPKKHRVITRLNGVEKQNESFEKMLFSVEQVSDTKHVVQHLGREARSPHPEQHHVCESGIADRTGKRAEASNLGSHDVENVEPPEAIRNL